MSFENYKVTDYAQTTLSGSISDSATSLIVATWDGALYPSTWDFFLTLEAVTLNEHETETITKREQVKCTARSSDSFTIVRGQNGTTAQSFTDGDRVSLYFVAENLDDINTEVARLETDKLDNDELRTWLGASKVLTTNVSGVETELAFSGVATDALLWDGTWGTTPVNINWQTLENGTLASGDEIVFYDASAASLRKRNMTATTTREWLVELATDAEVLARTAWKIPDASQIWKYFKVTSDNYSTIDQSTGSELYSNDTLTSTTSTSYVKLRDVEVTYSWTYRVYFDLSFTTGGWRWRIYVNDVAVWTERSLAAWYWEEITVNAWDNIQIYARVASWWPAIIENFRLFWLTYIYNSWTTII